MQISKYKDLDSKTKKSLLDYIDEEFGHIDIVKKTKWATPDWTIIYYQDNKIVTFLNIIEREIFIDNNKYKISGINNVITPKEHRGKGFASKILQKVEDLIFDDLKSEFGVLLCADNLIPFYEKLNWYKIDCPVYFDQSDGQKLWSANTMFLSRNRKTIPKHINLNGLPW